MSSRSQLLKGSWETRRYVEPPAMAEERIIFADEAQSTVTPYRFFANISDMKMPGSGAMSVGMIRPMTP